MYVSDTFVRSSEGNECAATDRRASTRARETTTRARARGRRRARDEFVRFGSREKETERRARDGRRDDVIHPFARAFIHHADRERAKTKPTSDRDGRGGERETIDEA